MPRRPTGPDPDQELNAHRRQLHTAGLDAEAHRAGVTALTPADVRAKSRAFVARLPRGTYESWAAGGTELIGVLADGTRLHGRPSFVLNPYVWEECELEAFDNETMAGAFGHDVARFTTRLPPYPRTLWRLPLTIDPACGLDQLQFRFQETL